MLGNTSSSASHSFTETVAIDLSLVPRTSLATGLSKLPVPVVNYSPVHQAFSLIKKLILSTNTCATITLTDTSYLALPS